MIYGILICIISLPFFFFFFFCCYIDGMVGGEVWLPRPKFFLCTGQRLFLSPDNTSKCSYFKKFILFILLTLLIVILKQVKTALSLTTQTNISNYKTLSLEIATNKCLFLVNTSWNCFVVGYIFQIQYYYWAEPFVGFYNS